jgi:hypothetical protein
MKFLKWACDKHARAFRGYVSTKVKCDEALSLCAMCVSYAAQFELVSWFDHEQHTTCIANVQLAVFSSVCRRINTCMLMIRVGVFSTGRTLGPLVA